MEAIEDKLYQILDTVLSSLVDGEISVCPDENVDSLEYRLSSHVTVTGTWEGVITTECSEAKAVELAAAMFEMEGNELAEDDVRDAIGEVANLLAGQYKCELPEGCLLSLPTVTKGTDYLVNVPGGRVVGQLSVKHKEDRVQLVVIERK